MKLFKYLIVFLSFLITLACDPQSTKKAIYYNNIGLESKYLSVYKAVNRDGEQNLTSDIKLILAFKDNKYYFRLVADKFDNTNTTLIKGYFIPSKIPNTNLYIFSCPEFILKEYNKKNHTKMIKYTNNALMYVKLNKDTMLVWLRLLSKDEVKLNTEQLKKIISKKIYAKTLINKAILKFKKIDSNLTLKDFNQYIKSTESKYSYFKTK